MEISFKSKKVRRLCEDQEFAVQQLGVEVAQVLKVLIADFRAAENLEEILIRKIKKREDEGKLLFQVELSENHLLIFAINHTKPERFNSDLTYKMAERIIVIEILKKDEQDFIISA